MTATLPKPPIDYRRLARRVRCRLGNDPIGKQQALAALARRADRSSGNRAGDRAGDRADRGADRSGRSIGPDPCPMAITGSTPDAGVRAFAAAVSSSLEGPVLRFSRRQQLIRQAEELGIRRFDANLLIAAVQHRFESEKTPKVVKSEPSRSPWRFAPIGLAIGVQAVIFFGAWGLLHS